MSTRYAVADKAGEFVRGMEFDSRSDAVDFRAKYVALASDRRSTEDYDIFEFEEEAA